MRYHNTRKYSAHKCRTNVRTMKKKVGVLIATRIDGCYSIGNISSLCLDNEHSFTIQYEQIRILCPHSRQVKIRLGLVTSCH